MAIEIADLPINSMVIFHSYVTNLPEGSDVKLLWEIGIGIGGRHSTWVTKHLFSFWMGEWTG